MYTLIVTAKEQLDVKHFIIYNDVWVFRKALILSSEVFIPSAIVSYSSDAFITESTCTSNIFTKQLYLLVLSYVTTHVVV